MGCRCSERWSWMQAARKAGQQQVADRPRTVPAAPQLLHPHTCRATPKRPMKGMEATPAFETPEGVKKVAMTAWGAENASRSVHRQGIECASLSLFAS